MTENPQEIKRCLKKTGTAIVLTLWLLLTDRQKRKEAWKETA